MDITDINKAASRKRANADAANIKELMTRQSSKLIKLRVAQDTTGWELREKVSRLEAEHQRLQQNLLDAQTQCEKLSARYQDELRHRPETLNRVASTRALCDVLEEHAGRVRASLRRAAADRAALAASYGDAARRVQAAHAIHAQAAKDAHQSYAAAAQAVRSCSERVAQLTASEAEARRESGTSRDALAAAAERAGRLQARVDELQDGTAALHAALHERERTIVELRREVALHAAEGERAERYRADLQREAEACGAQLAETRTTLAAAEARYNGLVAEATVWRTDADQKLEAIRGDLERQLANAVAANEALRDDLKQREREASESATRAEAARTEVEGLHAALREEREARARDSAAAESGRAQAERAQAERADTVAGLMRDVAAEAEARARTDAALQLARTDTQALQRQLQAQGEELAEQEKITQEMTKEKERLQEMIGQMQGTIDNFQREMRRVSVPRAEPARANTRNEQPEHDQHESARHVPAPTPAPAPPPPACKPDADDDLFFRFSDSSLDGYALDTNEVNARFEALSCGAVLPPISLQALKRRPRPATPQPAPAPSATVAPRALTPMPGAGDGAIISQSQVKTELALRERSFFRNKRQPPVVSAKPRKFK